MSDVSAVAYSSTIVGSAGGDFIAGGPGDQSISGVDGSDTLYGDSAGYVIESTLTGNDFIDGGTGNDVIVGEANGALRNATTEGDDILLGGAGNDLIIGDNKSVERDSISMGDDTVDAGDGSDTVYGDAEAAFTRATIQGDDEILGGAGSDTLGGDVGFVQGGVSVTGHDYIEGGAGDDKVYGDGLTLSLGSTALGNDILAGGSGNDTLWGDWLTIDSTSSASGADTFVFRFDATTATQTTTQEVTTTREVVEDVTVITEHNETFADWLSGLGLAPSGLTQSQFSTQYTAWLNHLVSTYSQDGLGADVDGDGVISVGTNQNSPSGLPTIEGLTAQQVDALFDDATSLSVKTGKTTQTRYYSNEFGFETSHTEQVTRTIVETTTITITTTVLDDVASGDGHDFIGDFVLGTDMLRFEADAFTTYDPHAFFAIEAADFNADGRTDTRIVLQDEAGLAQSARSWSVTLSGVDLGFGTLDDLVTFGATTTAADWSVDSSSGQWMLA